MRQLDKHKKRHKRDNAPLSVRIIFPLLISPPNTFPDSVIVCLEPELLTANFFWTSFLSEMLPLACFVFNAKNGVKESHGWRAKIPERTKLVLQLPFIRQQWQMGISRVLLLMLFKLDDTPPPLQKKDMFSKSFFVKGIYYGGYKTKI